MSLKGSNSTPLVRKGLRESLKGSSEIFLQTRHCVANERDTVDATQNHKNK